MAKALTYKEAVKAFARHQEALLEAGGVFTSSIVPSQAAALAIIYKKPKEKTLDDIIMERARMFGIKRRL